MFPGCKNRRNMVFFLCRFMRRALHIRQAVGLYPPKGGEIMRFTFTFYVGRKTITLSIIVKSKNRHSAK